MTKDQMKAIENSAPKFANVKIDSKSGRITITEGTEAIQGNVVNS